MRIAVVGAGGFIGSAVAARLRALGHEVVPVGRGGSAGPDAVRADLATTSAADWARHLAGVDALVNATGILQGTGRDTPEAVHVTGARALWQGAEAARVRRVVHVSALGAAPDAPTDFARTKAAGDADLMARDLDWVVLRPAVVLGRPAYGGSALIRGLAALPVMPVLPGTAPIQLVALDDLVETVVRALAPDARTRVVYELAGTDPLPFETVVAALRRWLGWRPARRVAVPAFLATLAYRAGDLVARLGWRTPLRSTARAEIARGTRGDPTEWIGGTGIVPKSLDGMLAAMPASVQERWFARLYFVKPLLFASLAFFWFVTGLVSIGPGWEVGLGYVTAAGFGVLGTPSILVGGVIDLVIGIAVATRRFARWGLYAGIAVSLFYAVAGSVVLPSLWQDPLGPLLKIWPLIAANLAALAILEER